MSRLLLFAGQDAGHQLVTALAPLHELLVCSFETERDREKGYRSALEAARKFGSKFLDVTTASKEQIFSAARSFVPDLIVSAYYAKIIPAEIISLAPSVNVHPGDLPNYRGRFPTPWMILNGETRFPMTLHALDDGIDTGPIYAKKWLDIPPRITGFELYKLTQDSVAETVAEFLPSILSGELRPVPQSGVGSYYATIDPTWRVDWNLSVPEIDRRIRVHAPPYNPVTAEIDGVTYQIHKATPLDVAGFAAQGGGKVISREPLVISCRDGCIRIDEAKALERRPRLNLIDGDRSEAARRVKTE